MLVHTCCAPCAAPSGEKLMLRGFEVILYFSNSNIFPTEEYQRRLDSARRLAQIWEVVIEEDTYDHTEWLKRIRGHESDPEKGMRCRLCFDYSLTRTAEMADRLNIAYFTTTLTLSPHKVTQMIFAIGNRFPKFAPFDFKKENGFLRSLQLSRTYNLYRQGYCGCEFSLRDRQQRLTAGSGSVPAK